MEYDYIIVTDTNMREFHIEDRLRSDWRIARVTATQTSVHYILEREVPVPPAPEDDTTSADKTSAEPVIEDIDDQPIDLSDINF